MTIGSSLRAIDILGEIWFTCDMTKSESIAYLRRKVLLERLSMTTGTNPEAAEELKKLEESPEEEQSRRGIKELTKEFDNPSE